VYKREIDRAGPFFYQLLAAARGTPDLYALKRYDSAAPWNNHAVANPAKNGLGGVDFRYRRTKSGRLLEVMQRFEVHFEPTGKKRKQPYSGNAIG